MTLTEVLDELERRAIPVTAVVVGDVRLVFASAWPVPRVAAPPVDPQAAEVLKDKPEDDIDMVKARKVSRQTFGRVLPDDQLREYVKAGLL